MSSMLATITPKTDQQNFDDFIGGVTKTIKITGVKITTGDQPVAIHFEGDNGKPYKPGKSMRRVLVHCWGSDAKKYIGRSMILYGDPKVRFGGADVGGIRISHLSDIDAPITMALTATRAQRKPFTVQPLATTPAKQATGNPDFDALVQEAYGVTTLEGVENIAKRAKTLAKGASSAKIKELQDLLASKRIEFKAQADRQPGDE